MKKIIILFSLLFWANAFALVAGPSRIQGTIKSFDERTVLVESDDAKFEIPRDLVAEKLLKVGGKIEVLLSIDQTKKVKVIKKRTEQK